MRFSLSIPALSIMRVGKEGYKTLPKGSLLHRIHPSLYGAGQFNPTDQGNARFSPIRDGEGHIIPTIYAAQTFACAVCEVILRCPDMMIAEGTVQSPVFPSDFRAYSHSIIQTTADMRLFDATGAGQRKIGISHNALTAGPRSTYPQTRAWAQHIHARCPTAQGIYYTSIQHGPDFAIVLFGDRVLPETVRPCDSRSVSAAPCHNDICAVAAGLSIDYEDV